MRPTFAAVVGAVVSLVAMPAPAVADGPAVNLQFRGQAIAPTGTVYRGTTVGGLSSITYDAPRGVFYALSDDILRYNLQTGRLDRQWVYETDAVAQPPAPATQFTQFLLFALGR